MVVACIAPERKGRVQAGPVGQGNAEVVEVALTASDVPDVDLIRPEISRLNQQRLVVDAHRRIGRLRLYIDLQSVILHRNIDIHSLGPGMLRNGKTKASSVDDER